jgi:hypothetical protein
MGEPQLIRTSRDEQHSDDNRKHAVVRPPASASPTVVAIAASCTASHQDDEPSLSLRRN